MITHNLIQGTPEWHAYRSQHFNASDAPAMMGVSSYRTRTQLLDQMTTGLTQEVDTSTQRLFDEGHRYEALARPLAEEIVGEDLYPVTGSNGKLSASFDGLTLMNDVAFEHKMLNERIRNALSATGATANNLPMEYQVQMEQQCLVSDCERVLFMATSWNGDQLVEKIHAWYTPNPDLRQKIVQGWNQFENDLAGHVNTVEVIKPKGFSPETLPALRIELVGQVQTTNLPVFKAVAIKVLNDISTDLKTDQDFADAEQTVKWCADVETRLEAAKQHALSQTASIEELFRTVDEISELTRQKRLALEKLVKTQKENIRLGIVQTAAKQWSSFVQDANEQFGFVVSFAAPDFGAEVKGKRTVKSMQDAVDTKLAQAKAAGNETILQVTKNLKTFDELTNGHTALFHDKAVMVQKPADVMVALIEQRIAQAQKEAQQREENQRKAAELAAQTADIKDPAPMANSANMATTNNVTSMRVANTQGGRTTITKPSDTQIIDALCQHFRVHQSKVIEWLFSMDLTNPELVKEI